MADTTLAELILKVQADVTDANKKLDSLTQKTAETSAKMEKAFTGTRDVLKTLGEAFTLYFGASYFKGVFEATDHINDLSERLGISTEALSNLGYAAKISGANLETVVQGLTLMGDNITSAAAGIGTAGNALKQLHLTAQDLSKLTLDQQFERISEALKDIPNSGDRIGIMRDLMGRMGAELIPLAMQFDELRKEAEAVGYTISDQTAQQFGKLGDELDRLSLGTEALVRNLEAMLVPALNDAVKGFNQLFAGAENTSKLFNTLGGIYVKAANALGLVDDETARNALDVGADNIAKGMRQDEIAARSFKGSPSRRISSKKEKLELPADYDASAFQKYLNDLDSETEALTKSDRELAIRKALTEAMTDAQKDYNDGIRDTPLLYKEEIEQVEALAAKHYELSEAMRENKKNAREWQQQLTDGLTNVVLDFKNASSAASGFFNTIASAILKKSVTGPLADSIMGAFTGGSDGGLLAGIGKFLGFRAGGGPVDAGGSYIVGENGPELFTPNVAGNITPNNKIGGGQQIIVAPVIHVSTGVQATVRAELMNMMPVIQNATTSGVFAAIGQGGAAARAIGLRA
jgi:hypothetical protein